MTIEKYIATVLQQLTTLLKALGAPNGLITRGISRYASVLNDSFLHYKQLTRTLPYSQYVVGFPHLQQTIIPATLQELGYTVSLSLLFDPINDWYLPYQESKLGVLSGTEISTPQEELMT